MYPLPASVKYRFVTHETVKYIGNQLLNNSMVEINYHYIHHSFTYKPF